MTPFERFFAEDFPRLLATAKGEPGLFSNGQPLARASWDRKAAYLVWVSLRSAAASADALGLLGDDEDDLIGGAAAQEDDEDVLI